MKRLPRYIHLVVFLFAGLLTYGALALSISEDPIGDSDGLTSVPPSTLAPCVIPRSASAVGSAVQNPSSRRLLCSENDDNKYDKLLLASSDGTVYLMDGQSMLPLWRFVTGSPLLHSKRADPNVEYFIDFGDNGQLYEYSNSFGRRELNLTFEELFHKPRTIEDSSVTLGSKTTTLHFLNETNGKVLATLQWPGMQTKIGAPLVEEKLVASRPGSADGYILLERTDNMVRSMALPIDPTQISPTACEPLWQLSQSHIRATYIKSGKPSNMVDKLELPSCQIDIPVYPLPMASKIRGAITEDLMLPSASDPYYDDRNQDSLMTPISLDTAKSIAATFQHYSGTLEIPELPDQKHLSSAHVFSSQSDETSPDHNVSNMSANFHNNTKWYMHGNDSADVKSFSELINGVAYRNLDKIMIISLFLIFALWLLKSRIAVKYVEKLSIKEKQSITRKKKSRKAANVKNSTVSNFEKVASSKNERVETHSWSHAQSDCLNSNLFSSLDAGDGRWVGKLFVSNLEIGRGSNGTVVFEGVYDGRSVAVKRLLRAHNDVAHKEIHTLILSDQHPNIVRLYGVEEDLDFVYISLERCSCNLSDLIQLFADSSLHPAVTDNQTSNSTSEPNISLCYEKGIKKDLELWRANGLPSPQLVKLMRDVVAGLAHLHALGFIHRDMKPHNVLISTDRYLNAKVSDMGISKRLEDDMSSLSHHATGYGSSGWQAPEQLLQGRQSRAVDLFSLGCVLFFCITKGRHPFGNHFERDSNIIDNRIDLFLVDHIPEAVDLLSQLLDHDPNKRPNAVEVFHHPFFWSSEMRLTFLRDTSDRVELEDRDNDSELLKELENVAAAAFGGKWGEKLDAVFITDMGRYRKYKFDCTRDLLRVIRNKLNHYRELPDKLQEILGSVPEGFDTYFSSRFPKLLIEVYKVVRRHCIDEASFSKYFKSTLDWFCEYHQCCTPCCKNIKEHPASAAFRLNVICVNM